MFKLDLLPSLHMSPGTVKETRSNFTMCSIFDLINVKNALEWNTSTSSKVNPFMARYFPVQSEERDPEFILDD